ncbi:MAG TPA: twin-arginine translocase TatA/TatE family subunit [Chloroflexota bacterium]|jgi:sec-independent protein translocase protein TatA|nr:twin-arginine translocase TatA/TatE family subunit [Chloroflexota bacterium]
MGALQPAHLIVVLVIILIIFGPGKLPQLGKAVGDGIRELKHASSETDAKNADPTAQPPHCAQCGAAVTVPSKFCGACGATLPAAIAR